MSAPSKVQVWDRHAEQLVTERVPMERAMRALHGTRAGRIACALWVARPGASRLYARLRATGPTSTRAIAPFIEQYDVDMNEFIVPEGGYTSFDAFFARAFREGRRPFTDSPKLLAAPAEARVCAWRSVHEIDSFYVKRQYLTPQVILDDEALAARFEGGPVVLCRLAPQDYHRFHYPDGATIAAMRHVPGALYSVHPIALSLWRDGAAMCLNERHTSVLETDHFGALAMVEVGAITVGRILQHHEPGERVERGQEKGMFRYGGSSIVIFGERGAWSPDEAIATRTRQGIETLVRLGTPIGQRS